MSLLAPFPYFGGKRLIVHARGMGITAIAAEMRVPYRECIAVVDGRPL